MSSATATRGTEPHVAPADRSPDRTVAWTHPVHGDVPTAITSAWVVPDGEELRIFVRVHHDVPERADHPRLGPVDPSFSMGVLHAHGATFPDANRPDVKPAGHHELAIALQDQLNFDQIVALLNTTTDDRVPRAGLRFVPAMHALRDLPAPQRAVGLALLATLVPSAEPTGNEQLLDTATLTATIEALTRD